MSQDNQATMDWANIKRYENENAALLSDVDHENRVVFMGNSITESWKAINPLFFKNKNYINRGISGQTTSQMLIRFRSDVINLNPSLVVILAGINDIAENTGPISLQNIFGNIVSMVELAKSNKIKVVLSSVLPANYFSWRPHIKPAEKIIKLNSMLEKYAIDNKIPYVNYYEKMVDADKGLNKKYTKDGVHPTIEGYKIMEPLVEKAIHEAL